MNNSLTNRQRFINVMEYQPVDHVPNWEVGVWGQTRERWKQEGLATHDLHWDWFTGEDAFEFDLREYIPVNFDMVPPFEERTIEEDERVRVFLDSKGQTRRALKEGAVGGTRMSMDTFLAHPVTDRASFRELTKRYCPTTPSRYPLGWKTFRLAGWRNRDHVLVLGRNCSTLGFYWRAREWMGTENLSYAWYDEPELMHEMMAFIADFTIQVARPVLEETDVDYVFINEDMAMKNGPLLSPDTYKTFIYPHMRRLVDFLKSNGSRYVIVDSDGNTEPLLPLLMDAGIDAIWPMEQASADQDPHFLRKKYGKSLRLWGGVDKRELTKDFRSIDEHLSSLTDLVEQGGFIPTVDHTVPPDVSLENFRYYMRRKQDLLAGRL
jgi:uroporphyrinogen decarboxylase